jgi:hypothetical protein
MSGLRLLGDDAMTARTITETGEDVRLSALPDRRYNATTHGVLSRHTVLPWEDGAEYEGLLQSFLAEYNPTGPTEEHLVEEIAGIVWRKRRLRMAEGVAYRETLRDKVRGSANSTDYLRDRDRARMVEAACVDIAGPNFNGKCSDLSEAITSDNASTKEELADIEALLKAVGRARKLLKAEDPTSYPRALASLGRVTREWWAEELEEADPEEGYKPVAEHLAEFLEREAEPHLMKELAGLRVREPVRDFALASSLDPIKMDNLARYETHLDRKLERTLAMLLRIQELHKQGD